jgi:hypothetical protein
MAGIVSILCGSVQVSGESPFRLSVSYTHVQAQGPSGIERSVEGIGDAINQPLICSVV